MLTRLSFLTKGYHIVFVDYNQVIRSPLNSKHKWLVCEHRSPFPNKTFHLRLEIVGQKYSHKVHGQTKMFLFGWRIFGGKFTLTLFNQQVF